MHYIIQRIFLTVFFLVGVTSLKATHLRSAEIIVERVPNSFNEFKITLVVFLDLRSNTDFGNSFYSYLDFGDNSQVPVVPTTPKTPRPDLGPDIATASFVVNHTYTNPGIYKILYFERDRSSGVLNITDPGDTPYSTYTEINTDPKFGFNSFPRLAINPVDRTCPGVTFLHNAGVRDDNGDSLSYELTTPLGFPNNPPQYFSVIDPRFYIDFNTANEDDNATPTLSVDVKSGLVIWDAPELIGEYTIAFKIIEWRRDPVTNALEILSTTIRDMQVIIENCVNGRPDLIIPSDVCVLAGTSLQANIQGNDPEGDNVKIEPVSEILDLSDNPAAVTPGIPGFLNSPAVIDFEWNTTCNHVRDQPYQVVFKISDKPKFGTSLVTFKTWSIRVLAPAPTGINASLDLVNRTALIEWDLYSCANAERIQIWRKVGSFGYTPTPCDPGDPTSLGYELIDEVNASQQNYVDNDSGGDLVAGARYCYRLVAVFKMPAGGKSFMSDEVCVGPIKADAPIITNVSVNKTDPKAGKINVKWRSPFEIDYNLFPKPFKYDVYRSTIGVAGEKLKVADQISDTTFFDMDINTVDKMYAYTVVVFAKPNTSGTYIPVDTSATASSVRLEAVPGVKTIRLAWIATVPWSNVIEESPWHYIYRSKLDDNTLTLVDSVNVSEGNFAYEDKTVNENEFYFYYVETIGGYGNVKIGVLKNASQVVSLYPLNDLLPCAPKASVILTDCKEFLENENTCERFDLNSTVFWKPSFEDGCRIDIKSYNVYTANTIDGEYTLLADNVQDTVLIETALSSLARCYRVAAIDASGHVSEWSEPVCNDNCPYYELPNVFTPDDNGYNDLFSAYFKPVQGDETIKYNNVNRCPRFVERVNISVFNRWGKEVYTYSSDDGRSIYINWNGKNKNGVDLEVGVYYYVADVTFKVIDPTKRDKKIKGWVHLVR